MNMNAIIDASLDDVYGNGSSRVPVEESCFRRGGQLYCAVGGVWLERADAPGTGATGERGHPPPLVHFRQYEVMDFYAF